MSPDSGNGTFGGSGLPMKCRRHPLIHIRLSAGLKMAGCPMHAPFAQSPALWVQLGIGSLKITKKTIYVRDCL